MERTFRPVFLLLAARTVGLAATFFIPVLLARLFDQHDFGTYKQLFLVFASLYTIAQVGMAESLFYFLPLDPKRGGSLTSNALGVLLAAGVVAFAALWIGAGPIARAMGNPELESGLPYIGVFVGLMIASAVLEIDMMSRKQYGRAAWTYLISDLGRAGFLVVPMLLWPTMQVLLVSSVIFAALRLGATIVSLKKAYGEGMRWSGELVRKQLAYAVPFALAVVVETVQQQLHQYVVSYYFDPATFAIYSVACLQIPLVGYAATSASDVLMVRMGESLRDGSPESAVHAWHDTVRKLALLFFPVLALLFVIGDELIVLLFTESYAEAAPLFKLASVTIAAAAIPTDSVLRVYAQTRFIFVLNLVRVAIVIATIGAFLSMFHLAGAILVTVLSTVLTKGIALFRIAQLMRVRKRDLLPWRSLGAGAAVACAAGLAAQIFRSSVTLPQLPMLASSSAVCGIAYFGLAAAFGVVPKNELLALLGRQKSAQA
jgi:O-antigen/teichoic acid export membrane protein